MTHRLFPWFVLSGVLACASPRDATPTSLQPSAAPTELRADAPAASFPQRALGTPPRQLQLEIRSIENPEGVAFSVVARIESSDGGEELGVVSPYPATQTGTYHIAVPADVSETLADREFTLRLSVAPMPGAALPNTFVVRVAEVRWL